MNDVAEPRHDFWLSCGLQLLEPGENGWAAVTPDYVRAYLGRPELRPVEESCASEVALFDALMDDPGLAVPDERLAKLDDPDAQENYRVVLGFRDLLLRAGTIEAAYLEVVRTGNLAVPPLFLDQLVHAILRNVLAKVNDPIRLRAAEIFFREQNVNTENNQLMLADEEVVEMHAASAASGGSAGGLGQLLVESGTRMRSVELDVLDEDNAEIYWTRSDQFDTVIDFRFGQPALDAFCRVLEAWVRHMTGHQVRVQPRKAIEDDDWRWHIGLDREATALLNQLYQGESLTLDDLSRLIGLFQMTFVDEAALQPDMRGRPIYLGLAMSADQRVRMKPQNLIANLPVGRAM